MVVAAAAAAAVVVVVVVVVLLLLLLLLLLLCISRFSADWVRRRFACAFRPSIHSAVMMGCVGACLSVRHSHGVVSVPILVRVFYVVHPT